MFTEALKERIRSTTKISIVTAEGKANMGGSITGYNYAPVSIRATNPNQAPIANASVLTITVRVKFVYDADKNLILIRLLLKRLILPGTLTRRSRP
ncbi:hypothetical protein [Mucilaginibacter humi]|uniref:hypothetical protein n=1 Tax=Mucilaginibacter humi TaxID=2732510 RepID=UPI003742253E